MLLTEIDFNKVKEPVILNVLCSYFMHWFCGTKDIKEYSKNPACADEIIRVLVDRQSIMTMSAEGWYDGMSYYVTMKDCFTIPKDADVGESSLSFDGYEASLSLAVARCFLNFFANKKVIFENRFMIETLDQRDEEYKSQVENEFVDEYKKELGIVKTMLMEKFNDYKRVS